MSKIKIDIKKVIATIVAAGVLASGSAVFADYNPDKEKEVLEGGIVTTIIDVNENEVDDDYRIYNGMTIARVEVTEIDGQKYFPLREVVEMLGYTVEWIDEGQVVQLFRGNQSIGMRIGADEYAYLKMAPREIGAAPVLVDNATTYAPVALLTEIMGARVYDNEDGSIQVVQAAQVTLNEVKENEDGNISLSVQDAAIGEVIVHISENTEMNIELSELKELEKGASLAIGYSAAMTMSIPPQTTALFIFDPTVPEDIEEENNEIKDVEFSGVIKSVGENNILIDEDGYERVLNITEDTAITSGDEKRLYTIEDLEEGAEVTGVRSAIETRSLPPISNAISINIVK